MPRKFSNRRFRNHLLGARGNGFRQETEFMFYWMLEKGPSTRNNSIPASAVWRLKAFFSHEPRKRSRPYNCVLMYETKYEASAMEAIQTRQK